MKGLCLNIRQMVSSKKFYEIVSKQKERIMPKSPEEAIISKYLRNSDPPIKEQQHDSSKPNSKNAKANPTGIDYYEIIGQNPNGSIIQQEYKDTHLSLMSLNYRNINLPDVYQVCQKANPDLILVQARPEAYLSNFQLIPKYGGVFSDRRYLQQLTLAPQAIRKSILDQALTGKLQGILGLRDKTNEKVFIRDNRDLVDDDIVLMTSYFASSNSATLMFGELPQQPWREWFCNSHTLMELQEIFKFITKNIPFYSSLQLSPYRLGALLKPNLFLTIRDRYMATLVQMAIATKKYKRILCILGVAQNQAVNQILLKESLIKKQGGRQDFTPILQYLIAPEIKHSVLRNIQGWQIIEKHILLDILHYGQQILNEPLQNFPTTNKVIAHYGININEYPQQTLMKFRYDKAMGYVQLMREQVREGERLKRKLMMREAMRQAEA